ncbi:MAG TPA: sulfite exporter TauE/SafE family protein [Rhizomicrobium sp.]|nr:sulfite exporter TauE/SafE family protein [Rhizomicrobium sp.]
MFAGLYGDLGTLALGLVIAAVVSGVVGGMLGLGSGIVIVPVLYHVLASAGVPEDMRMHMAIGTSLAAIVPTALSSLASNIKDGTVDWTLVKRFAAPLAAGVALGAAADWLVPGQVLALVFGLVALPVAGELAFAKESWRLAESVPGGAAGIALPFGIGTLSTVMGIGGSTFAVPAMTLCGVPLSRAAATASAFAVMISVPGAIAAALTGWDAPHLPAASYGYVNLLGFALVAPVTFVVTPLGARYAHLTDRTRLSRTFSLFVAVTAAKMLWDAVN